MILICVALFAALSFVFTDTSRTGSGATREQAKIVASQYLQFLLSVRQGMQRVMLSNGCAYNEISAVNSTYVRISGIAVEDWGAPNAPASLRCHLFDPAGAGVPTFYPENSPFLMTDSEMLAQGLATSTRRAGHFSLRLVNLQDVGTSANDMAYYSAYFKTPLCLAMLDAIGLSATSVPVNNFTTNGTAGWWQSLTAAAYSPAISSANISSSGVFVVRGVNQDYCSIGIALFER